MKKKGVSPVIATVLLIAIVVVIALIIFLWFRGMTQEAVMKFGKNIELVCDEVQFDASYDVANTFTVSNNGNVPIQEMKIKIIGGGSSDLESLGDSGVSVGGVQEYTHDVSGASEVILIPVLRGKSEKGETNHVCDENYGYRLLV